MSGYFVLTLSAAGSAVLNLDGPHSRAECEGKIAWQVKGGFDRSEYVVCSYSRETDSFRDDDGNEYRPERGPYTAAAWADFRQRVARN